jgi:Cu+-exporting ATPase
MMGKWLELLAKGRTSEAIQKLMQLQPPVAVVLQFDKGGHVVSETEVPTELLQLRDIVKVVPGSKIPCDGKVVTGWTAVDESMVTGESMPVSKTIGDKVVAGTVNTTGMVHVRAEGVGEQTMLANIIKLVEDAQTSKAPIQAYADYISARFVPVVVVTSVLVGVLWLVLVNTGAVPPSWLEVAVQPQPCTLSCMLNEQELGWKHSTVVRKGQRQTLPAHLYPEQAPEVLNEPRLATSVLRTPPRTLPTLG